ncbi:MAG: hypothetical protein K0S71_1132 [Clostridia bacterium]|nr:hypothetical protein [Clostridia bacterium]
MKKLISALLISLLFFTVSAAPFEVYGKKTSSVNRAVSNDCALELKMLQRKLWIDHVLWTRNFIVSDLAELNDKDAVTQRLLKNQDDIADSIRPYYGEDAGNNLSRLLREHIMIASQVVAAAKTGDKSAFDKHNKLWYANADMISEFLSSANPNWSSSDLRDMLYKHLSLLTDQVTARLNMDFKSDIDAYDKGEDHMIMFADTLSTGIIEQFPDKFKKDGCRRP